MATEELIRYHTLDGSFRDLRPSPTGAFIRYDIIKELILTNLKGLCGMVVTPESAGQALLHNTCLDKLAAIFEEHDPIDDEIKDLEDKLNELKDRKNAKNKT